MMITNKKQGRFDEFYSAYIFLEEHNLTKNYVGVDGVVRKLDRNRFKDCLDIFVAKVNPKTCELDKDSTLNTKTEIWLEFGAWSDENKSPYHDYDLDCGGDTFEEAIIKLANLVDEFYDEETGAKIKSNCGLFCG